MKIYLEVTPDKYELPVRMADTAAALARMVGCSVNNVYSGISHYEHGRHKSRFRKVEIEEVEDETEKA